MFRRFRVGGQTTTILTQGVLENLRQLEVDEQDWAKATSTNTIQGYEFYLERHREGKHVLEGNEIIESLRQRQQDDEFAKLNDAIQSKLNNETSSVKAIGSKDGPSEFGILSGRFVRDTNGSLKFYEGSKVYWKINNGKIQII